MACYQPFDLFWLSYLYFKTIQPEKYIITRHDIWPNHIILSKKYCKNIFLINANLPKSSKRLLPVISSLYKYLFSKFDTIYTVSETMKKELLKLVSANKLEIIGDTRFDQINYRFNNKQSWNK